MTHFLKVGILAATLGLGLSFAAQADEATDNAATQSRQHLMSGIGGAMGTLGCYMKGECALPDPVVANLAKGVAYAASAAPGAFEIATPDATLKTTAKADIWSDWDKFAPRFAVLEENALKLAAVAGDKAAMGPLLGEVGKSCKGCHDDFRSK
ncbi:cytochrome c [Thalassospira sp.]|uniref:c-type cytochrome n=1 Tax=Thalassospira sp. TaxID=1912094 RepID=UPI00273404AE|nr:cytochrome c [Thalassospira sp.]MDP2697406.1 cytochrome c [Thalassospira sp.]